MSTPPVATTPFPTVGTTLLERYELQQEIGRGGYSVVYAARDRELGHDVAVKLLVPPPASAHIARERMRREVKAVRGLAHRNIVALYDFKEDGPWSFIVMERIHGRNLSQHVARVGPIAIDDVIRIGSGVAAALAAAHARGILHRDVKPQNILLEGDGAPRLVDFGSARLDGHTVTRTGGLVGTIQYTAPELLLGDRADPRADVFSLGLTLYFALTGRLPPGASAHSAPPPKESGHQPGAFRSDVPQWLDEVVSRATCSRPEDRFPTAASFERALRWAERPAPNLTPENTRCLLCEKPEPFGLGICPSCGGAAHTARDALVFVKAPRDRDNVRRVEEALVPLLRGRSSAGERDLVAKGHQALVRISSTAGEAVLEALALRGVPARAKTAGRTWTSVPASYYGLLLAVVLAGGAAGLTAAPVMLWTSPLVAFLLLLAAQMRLQRPLIEAGPHRALFPPEVEQQLTTTLIELRDGSARTLLASLGRSAESVYRTLNKTRYPLVPTEQIDSLLVHACQAARDLASLDESLAQLESRSARRYDEAGPTWMDELLRAERLRDALIQNLLDGIAALQRIQVETIQADPARELLGELVEAIDEAARTHADALEDIDALLEGERAESQARGDELTDSAAEAAGDLPRPGAQASSQ